MTPREKKLIALGVAVGILTALLVVGILAIREFPSLAAARTLPELPTADSAQGAAHVKESGTQPGASVELSPAEITAAGVQVADVRTATLKTDIAAFGRVEQPEAQLAAVSARIGGRVDKLYVQYTGERVQRGQSVADVYSPDVATALDEYRLAQENRNQLRQSDDAYARQQADALVEASQRKLELWGISSQTDRRAGDKRHSACDHLLQRFWNGYRSQSYTGTICQRGRHAVHSGRPEPGMDQGGCV